jgi:2',3'-cyclic-nucleotide 2'-phosphodiesterase (5'-nucleotidase family)
MTAVAWIQPVAAETFSRPTAPSQVTATVQSGGVLVKWTGSENAMPPITHYVVHAGPDSCPVTVPASQQSALMPFIKGPATIVPKVQAVNAYGFSPNADAAPITVPRVATPGYRNVQFLQFSDFHGAIEPSRTSIGAAAMVSALANDRSTVLSSFVVSSGDNIGGSPAISKEFDEVPTIKALNLMGLDISTFGNHEHDEPLASLRSSIELSDFPWVASGYDSIDPLQGPSRSVKDVLVLERGRVKVGFIGLNTADLATRVDGESLKVQQGDQLEVKDGTAKIARLVGKAREQGAQLIVALVHQGWDANVDGQPIGPLIDVAYRLPGVDVIFGGDSHQQYASIVNDLAVAQVPNSGQMYSRTVVCLDTRSNRPIGTSIDFVTKAMLDGITEDSKTAAMVQRYRAALTARLDQKIGTVDGIFPRGGNPPVERSGETAMGDFATDVIRATYGTDFALLNGGGIRDTLPASSYRPADPALRRPGGPGPFDVVLGDLLSVFPFGNNVATTTVTGNGLWQALENGVSKWPTDGRFPQVSGLRFAFDPDRPVGSRVVSVTMPEGTPIAADGRAYTITTVDYLITGGDGYGSVFSPSSSVMREPYIDAVISAFKADLAAGRLTTVPRADGRIQNLSTKP